MACIDCVHLPVCSNCFIPSTCGHYKKATDVEWIRVENGLPEEKERVLVFLKNSKGARGYTRIDTDRLIKGNWIRWGSLVTHWMPLPEPPKGCENDGNI